MPLNGSGPISIGGSTAGQSINLEFGRTATQQTSMSQLYRGGGIVPNATANNAIPTSGAISLGNFYGATNRVTVNITIASNQTNYVLNTAKAAGYVAGVSDVVLTINSGVYVSSNSTGVYALDVDTSWAAGDTVRIDNNGFIVGMGGAGGRGGKDFSNSGADGTAGAGAGPALRAQRAVSFTNNGTIAGGGGGGGGGRGTRWSLHDGKGGYSYEHYSGGGGGGGRTGLTNSSGGLAGSSTGPGAGNPGGAGTASGPGAGGSPSASSPTFAGAGGSGGGWGAGGASGLAQSANPTSGAYALVNSDGPYGGGAAGAAVVGNGNVTWLATGTRLGNIT